MDKVHANESVANLQQELQVVKEMIQKTKQKAVDRGAFFLMWGSLVAIACFATFFLTELNQETLVWLPWATLMPIGMIISIFLMRRYSKKSKYTSYAESAYNSVWLACGIAFFIVVFMDSISPLFSTGAIYPVISLIAGIGIFASGGIMEWTSLKIGGLFWWAGAVTMMLVPTHYHPLIMAIVIIPGHLIPGYLLKRQFSRSE